MATAVGAGGSVAGGARPATPGLLPVAAAGAAAGSAAALGDFAGRLLMAYIGPYREGYDLALLSYLGLGLAVVSGVGVLAALLLRGAVPAAVRAVARWQGWRRTVATAAPGLLYLAWTVVAPRLLGDRARPDLALVAVAAAAILLLAHPLARCRGAGRTVLALAPLGFAALFLAASWLHAATSVREPAFDPLAVVGQASPEAPDILLVTLDTTRADFLGCYGRERARTPNLDRLAAAGVRYARCTAPNPSTQPSHASLLTGLQLPWHGMRVNGVASLDPAAATVAQRLAAAGYETRAVVASFVLDRQFGLSRGFGRYDDSMPQGFGPGAVQRRLAKRVLRQSLGSQMTRWLGVIHLFPDPVPDRDAAAVVAAAEAALADAPAGRPLFLWVHFWDPHAPYEPPEEFLESWQPEPDAPPEGYEYWFGTIGSLAELHARYAGEIAYADAQLGRLLEAFAARGRPRVVAVTGDHGEGLQEHGESSHGALLYETTLHVPLIVQGEGVPRGMVVRAPVASYDLAPTLLEIAGAEPLTEVHGRSLLPFGPDAPAAATGREFYHEASKKRKAGWRQGPWKLIESPEDRELYQVDRDPGEGEDLAPAETARVEVLAAALQAFLATFPAVERGVRLALDETVADNLAQLGYAGDDGPAGPEVR